MQSRLNTSSNIGRDKSFVDDLNKERGIVRMRVAFVPRSAEIQPLFWRFVTFTPHLITPHTSIRLLLPHSLADNTLGVVQLVGCGSRWNWVAQQTPFSRLYSYERRREKVRLFASCSSLEEVVAVGVWEAQRRVPWRLFSA